MKNKVLIIIQHLAVGGADKRIVQIWIELQKEGLSNIKLVIPPILYDKLLEVNELTDSVKKYKNNIIFLDWEGGTFIQYRKTIYKFIKNYDGAIFHFILFNPMLLLSLKKYKNIIYSYPMTSLSQLNIKGKLTVLMGFLLFNKIDLLNPHLYIKMKKLFFWKQENFFLTPGSFVDLSYYKPMPLVEKKNIIVFLGRFEEMKQIIKLLKYIPKINSLLNDAGIKDFEFHIIGRGTLENKVNEIVHSYNNLINIQVYHSPNPLATLRKSKIFLSLQKYSNYPSKSLLEAIACGNIPIVTDIGETRLIANPTFSYYVKENFSATDIAKQCIKILSLNDKEFLEKSNRGKKYLTENFDIIKSVKYFKKLYNH